MNFSVDKNITFDQAVELMFEKLGDWKIMALASSVNDYVMVRNVSCLFYDHKIYFKTDKNFRKTKQLYENPQVALCWSGVQVEGIAANKGLVIDEPGHRFQELYKKFLWAATISTPMKKTRSSSRSIPSTWRSGTPVRITTPIRSSSTSAMRAWKSSSTTIAEQRFPQGGGFL